MNEHYLKSFGCSFRLHKNQGKTSCGNSFARLHLRATHLWSKHVQTHRRVNVAAFTYVPMCPYALCMPNIFGTLTYRTLQFTYLRANWIVNSNLQSYFNRNIFIPIHKMYTSSSKVLIQLNCTVYRTFATLYSALFHRECLRPWLNAVDFVTFSKIFAKCRQSLSYQKSK